MANYKMKPGSKQKDTPGSFNIRQSDTISKLNFSPKIGIGRKKQAQKTIDSTTQAIKYNDTIMAIKRRIGKSGGFTTSNEGLYRENRTSEERRRRANTILYGTEVGPKKPKKRKLGPGN